MLLADAELETGDRITRSIEVAEFVRDCENAFAGIIVIASVDHDGGEQRPISVDLMTQNLAQQLRRLVPTLSAQMSSIQASGTTGDRIQAKGKLTEEARDRLVAAWSERESDRLGV